MKSKKKKNKLVFAAAVDLYRYVNVHWFVNISARNANNPNKQRLIISVKLLIKSSWCTDLISFYFNYDELQFIHGFKMECYLHWTLF